MWFFVRAILFCKRAKPTIENDHSRNEAKIKYSLSLLWRINKKIVISRYVKRKHVCVHIWWIIDVVFYLICKWNKDSWKYYKKIFIMLVLLFGFGPSRFHCNSHCLMLLSVFVITILWDSVDTAETAIRRHEHIQSTPILSNVSTSISSVRVPSPLSSSSALSLSSSLKSYSDSPTISVVTTKKYGLFYSSNWFSIIFLLMCFND